jgi:membrane protein involved in colicin uptake
MKAMRHLLLACTFGLIAIAPLGSAAALAVLPAPAERSLPEDACMVSGCIQQAQMMGPFGDRTASEALPADQRTLLDRLLSRELEGVVTPAERQLLVQVRDRNQRLALEAVRELSLLLREKEELLQQQVAAAERERQERARAEAAERERERQLAEAERARAAEREREATAAAERDRQQVARVEAEQRQRQQAEAAAAAERDRQQAARAEAEQRQREAERQRQASPDERRQEAAVAEQDIELLFYDFPPLRPL